MSRTFTVGVRVRCWSEGRHFEVFAVSPHLQARCAYGAGGLGDGGMEGGGGWEEEEEEEVESFCRGS